MARKPRKKPGGLWYLGFLVTMMKSYRSNVQYSVRNCSTVQWLWLWITIIQPYAFSQDKWGALRYEVPFQLQPVRSFQTGLWYLVYWLLPTAWNRSVRVSLFWPIIWCRGCSDEWSTIYRSDPWRHGFVPLSEQSHIICCVIECN